MNDSCDFTKPAENPDEALTAVRVAAEAYWQDVGNRKNSTKTSLPLAA